MNFKELKETQQLDSFMQQMVLDAGLDSKTFMAYPEIFNPSALLSSFSVRDDCKTLIALADEKVVGLISFIQSDLTIVRSSFLNKLGLHSRGNDMEIAGEKSAGS